MKRTDNEDGGYILTVDNGMDLAVLDQSGNVLVRGKEVMIPPAGTLNTWVEIIEELPKPIEVDTEKEAWIAELKAELVRLENN